MGLDPCARSHRFVGDRHAYLHRCRSRSTLFPRRNGPGAGDDCDRDGWGPYRFTLTRSARSLPFTPTQLRPMQIEQMVAAVNLIEALGGGWDRSQLPTPSQVSQKASASDYKEQR